MSEAGFACPSCGLPLRVEQTRLCCADGHSFDQAREGYVNLLLHGKTGRTSGDSADMLRARRRFLDQGHFHPISLAIASVFPRDCDAAVDLGCGEG